MIVFAFVFYNCVSLSSSFFQCRYYRVRAGCRYKLFSVIVLAYCLVQFHHPCSRIFFLFFFIVAPFDYSRGQTCKHSSHLMILLREYKTNVNNNSFQLDTHRIWQKLSYFMAWEGGGPPMEWQQNKQAQTKLECHNFILMFFCVLFFYAHQTVIVFFPWCFRFGVEHMICSNTDFNLCSSILFKCIIQCLVWIVCINFCWPMRAREKNVHCEKLVANRVEMIWRNSIMLHFIHCISTAR